jgi:hypothetical protein
MRLIVGFSSLEVLFFGNHVEQNAGKVILGKFRQGSGRLGLRVGHHCLRMEQLLLEWLEQGLLHLDRLSLHLQLRIAGDLTVEEHLGLWGDQGWSDPLIIAQKWLSSDDRLLKLVRWGVK